jgi:hypothetical protein
MKEEARNFVLFCCNVHGTAGIDDQGTKTPRRNTTRHSIRFFVSLCLCDGVPLCSFSPNSSVFSVSPW